MMKNFGIGLALGIGFLGYTVPGVMAAPLAHSAPRAEKPKVFIVAVPGTVQLSGPTPTAGQGTELNATDSAVAFVADALMKSRRVTVMEENAPIKIKVQVLSLSRHVDTIQAPRQLGGIKIPNVKIPGVSSGTDVGLQRLTTKTVVRIEIVVDGELRGSFIGRGSSAGTGFFVREAGGQGGGDGGQGGGDGGQGGGGLAGGSFNYTKEAHANDDKALTGAIQDALKATIPTLERVATD